MTPVPALLVVLSATFLGSPAALAANPPAAAPAAPSAEAGDDTSSLASLLDQSVVSSASLESEGTLSAPAMVWSVSAGDLHRYGITTVAEAVGFLTGGMLPEMNLDVVEVGARGVMFSRDYGDHLLVQLDGHVLNEAWDGTAYLDRTLALPLEVIDHIEVVLGPGSVLYGSNAMLGVVNIITRRAKNYDGAHATLEWQAVSSVRGGLGYGSSFSLGQTPAELVVQLGYEHAVGPSVKLGPQDYGNDAVTGLPRRFTLGGVPTGVWGGTLDSGRFAEVPSAFASLHVGDLSLEVRGAMSKRGDPATADGAFDNQGTYERDRWISADLRWRHTLSSFVSTDVRLFADAYDYRWQVRSPAAESCLDGQTTGCDFHLLGRSKWIGAEARLRLDWTGDGRVPTLLGVEGLARSFGSTEDYAAFGGADVVTSDYDYAERGGGAYVQQLLQASGWLGFNLGARFDADQRFGSHLSPRAAVILTPWSGGALKAVYAEAFRAPNAYESYFTDPTGWVKAPTLTPETVRSVELSVEQRFGLHRVVAGVYRSRWRDIVAAVDLDQPEIDAAILAHELADGTTSASQYRNLDAVDSYGVDLAYEGSSLSSRLRYGLSLTLAHTRTGGDSPSRLPATGEIFGNAHAAYELGEGLPTVALAGRVVGPRQVSGTEFQPVPDAPTQVELRATLSGPVPGFAGLSYRATGMWTASNRTPYAVGPLTDPSATYTQQETMPADRYRVLVGLWYDLP